jgi:hypothetical protein
LWDGHFLNEVKRGGWTNGRFHGSPVYCLPQGRQGGEAGSLLGIGFLFCFAGFFSLLVEIKKSSIAHLFH